MDRTRTSRNASSHNEDGNPNFNRSARRPRNGGDTLETKFAFTRFPSNRNYFARDFRSAARSAITLLMRDGLPAGLQRRFENFFFRPLENSFLGTPPPRLVGMAALPFRNSPSLALAPG